MEGNTTAEPDDATSRAMATADDVIFLRPGDGRAYEFGPMHSVFKADGSETGDRYCVSEWWLDAGAAGPGAHVHEANEELFYVVEGTMTFLAGADWLEAPRLLSPDSRRHDP